MQSRVLDGDDGLAVKFLDQFDLFVGRDRALRILDAISPGGCFQFGQTADVDCSSLRWVSSIRSFWLRNVFTWTGR
jgi:hypothetical protein